MGMRCEEHHERAAMVAAHVGNAIVLPFLDDGTRLLKKIEELSYFQWNLVAEKSAKMPVLSAFPTLQSTR